MKVTLNTKNEDDLVKIWAVENASLLHTFTFEVCHNMLRPHRQNCETISNMEVIEKIGISIDDLSKGLEWLP